MEATYERGSPAVGLILLMAIMAIGFLWLRNGQHADQNHQEAPAARLLINQHAAASGEERSNAGRRGLTFYFSELHGTLLMLLHTGNGQATGWVIKITEQAAGRIVSLDQRIYERTVFTADELYWSAVLARDKYIPLSLALLIPAIAAGLIVALRVLTRRLREDGHDELAGRLDEELARYEKGGRR